MNNTRRIYFIFLLLFSFPAYAHPPYVAPYKTLVVIGVAILSSVATFMMLKKINNIARLIVSAVVLAAVLYGGTWVAFLSSF